MPNGEKREWAYLSEQEYISGLSALLTSLKQRGEIDAAQQAAYMDAALRQLVARGIHSGLPLYQQVSGRVMTPELWRKKYEAYTEPAYREQARIGELQAGIATAEERHWKEWQQKLASMRGQQIGTSDEAQRIRAYQEAQEGFRQRQAEQKWQVREEWMPQQKLMSQMYPAEWAKIQEKTKRAEWYASPDWRGGLGQAFTIQNLPEYKKLLAKQHLAGLWGQTELLAGKIAGEKEKETRMGELWAKPPQWAVPRQRA